MKFNKIINEVKGELKKNDQVTLANSHEIWTVGDEVGDYYTITSNTNGAEGRLSKYKIADVKRVPVLEFVTPDDKTAEIVKHQDNIKSIKGKMRKFKANSRKGKAFQNLEKDLERAELALKLCKKKTPYMGIY